MADKWCTIESDPGVFTELVQKIGVKGIQFEELFVLEDDILNQIKPIHGLIFLFKWQKDPEPRQTLEHYDPSLFFAKQTINNACATQAILSILMNNDKIELGEDLTNFKDFTLGLNPVDKGNSIGQHENIRTHHNSFARQDPFTIEDDQSKHAKEDDDVYHFVSYVPHKGTLYELDGLQPGPISFGEVTEENWLTKAKEEIQKRIEKYSATEIRFNLLAVIDDKKVKAEKELAALTGQEGKEAEIEMQNVIIAQETEKQAKWKTENERRRHNYVPLIFELLQ